MVYFAYSCCHHWQKYTGSATVRLTVAMSLAAHVAAARSTTSGDDDTLRTWANRHTRRGRSVRGIIMAEGWSKNSLDVSKCSRQALMAWKSCYEGATLYLSYKCMPVGMTRRPRVLVYDPVSCIQTAFSSAHVRLAIWTNGFCCGRQIVI